MFLLHFCLIFLSGRCNKKIKNAIINLIKYKQSIITYANCIEMLDNKFLEHCIVINMIHVF